jgi:hypothetical protein
VEEEKFEIEKGINPFKNDEKSPKINFPFVDFCDG